MTDDQVQAYTEWRVTADHAHPEWRDQPPYDFTWSPLTNPHLGDAEAAARAFAARPRDSLANVRLHSRTVTITSWVNEDIADTPE